MVLVACLKLFKFKRLPEPGVVICGSRAKPGAVTGRHSVFGGNGPPKGEGGVQVMSFWAGGGLGVWRDTHDTLRALWPQR